MVQHRSRRAARAQNSASGSVNLQPPIFNSERYRTSLEPERSELLAFATRAPIVQVREILAHAQDSTNPQIASAESDAWLSECQACEYATCSRSTLYGWRKKGLKSSKVGGRRLFRKSNLDAYLLAGEEVEHE